MPCRRPAALATALAAAVSIASLPVTAAPVPRHGPVALTAMPRLLPPIRAQSSDRSDWGGPDRYDGRDGLDPAGARRVIWLIGDRIRHCEAYAPVWRVDCLADGFKQIARGLPQGEAYSPLGRELSATADRLAALARRNADPAKPAERLRAQTRAGPRRTSRPIVAIDPRRLPAANAAAAAIVADLATTLLRSAPGEADIARIAAAVDGTRILLRSS